MCVEARVFSVLGTKRRAAERFFPSGIAPASHACLVLRIEAGWRPRSRKKSIAQLNGRVDMSSARDELARANFGNQSKG
jgi:hypothetical protein